MPKHDKNQYSLRAVYTHYKKSVPTAVDYKTHKLILDTWGNTVVDYLLEGKDVKLQQGLSVLGVRKKKVPTFVNRKESKLQGKLVLTPNTHSGFYGAMVYWRRHYTTIGTAGWEFKPSRFLARALGAIMQIPFGHTRFVKRALITRNVQSAKSAYNKIF